MSPDYPTEFPSDYTPSLIDITWARMMVNTIREGGIMIFPATLLVYQLHQELKVLELINPLILNIPDNALLHGRSHKVFESIGWKVVP